MPLCLIVEDHEDTREGYAEYFAVSGFTPMMAATADDVFTSTAAHVPDVIVLDLQLPGTDGWELARRLRTDPRLREVPIVAVSGRVLPAERARAKEVGCDVFLGKPCDPARIVMEAQKLIQKKRAQI
jgi:CheY-like chemotaxis protein